MAAEDDVLDEGEVYGFDNTLRLEVSIGFVLRVLKAGCRVG